MLLILLSDINPYTLKIGDLSGDLAVLPLSRYHYYTEHILEHIMPYQHLQWLSAQHLHNFLTQTFGLWFLVKPNEYKTHDFKHRCFKYA